ncbi:MerR family transcriptional regulator [Rheinheimera sp.]|uniref:MerR family transcriptional regulator n=1 Tax=Rheinheimera sp. TaxID=1869214 RepID=UPI00307D7E55
MYRIGQLAKLLNVSESKLRFLEEQGVIHSVRQANGYRYYNDDNKERLEIILKAQQMGFSLAEIRAVQRQHGSKEHPVDCQLLLPMLQKKLQELDQQMQQLQQQRRDMEQLVQQLTPVDP